MNKRVLSAFLLITACLFITGEAYSAWTQPKGYAYNQISFSHYWTYDKMSSIGFDADENITDLSTGIDKQESEEFRSTKLTYYSEYGVTDDITVFTTIPLDWQRSNDTLRFDRENGPYGLGDINLGIRYKLIDNIFGSGILSSFQGTVKIPPYEYGDPLVELSLGDGQVDAMAELLFGRGLGKGYAIVSLGYQYRFENDRISERHFKPSDRARVQLMGGYSLTSWLSVRGLLSFEKSIGNADVSHDLEIANRQFGYDPAHSKTVLIKDSLTLEPNILNAGVDVVFNVSPWLTFMKDKFPNKEIVFSYSRDLRGWGDLRTKDYSLGETLQLAFVFPAEGIFPINAFK